MSQAMLDAVDSYDASAACPNRPKNLPVGSGIWATLVVGVVYVLVCKRIRKYN